MALCLQWASRWQLPKRKTIYLTNRPQVAVPLLSNGSQMTSNVVRAKKGAHQAQPSVSLTFLPHFDVVCNLSLNRPTAAVNLFVLYDKKAKRN